MDVFRWRLATRPFAFGAPMAPEHRHVVGYDATEIERCPVARANVLLVKLPQPYPMIATTIGVAVKIEEHRLGCRAPDRGELPPIETGIGIDVIRVKLEDLLTITLRSTDQIVVGHGLLAPLARDFTQP